jgi:hypothetical protein
MSPHKHIEEWSSHPLAGIGDDFQMKVEIQKAMALINSLAAVSKNPEMLRFLRNRLLEPLGVVNSRLKDNEQVRV